MSGCRKGLARRGETSPPSASRSSCDTPPRRSVSRPRVGAVQRWFTSAGKAAHVPRSGLEISMVGTLHRSRRTRLFRRAGVALSAGMLSNACARTVWVNELDSPKCRDPQPVVTSAIESTTAASVAPNMLVGIVMRADSREPVRAAVILTSALPPDTAISDSLGRFRLARAGMVPWVLRTRAFGMDARTDTLSEQDASHLVRILLKPIAVVFDGPCSGFAMVPVRRPWWHFW